MIKCESVFLHGIETDHGQSIWNDLDVERPSFAKGMPLLGRDEIPPYLAVRPGPFIRASRELIMWRDIIVSNCRDHRHGASIHSTAIGNPKDLDELVRDQPVLIKHLLLGSRDLFVIRVTRRVSGPDDKVYRVLQVCLDPSEGRVDERKRRVAVAHLGAVVACGAGSSMACRIALGGRMDLVERVRMQVCVRSECQD